MTMVQGQQWEGRSGDSKQNIYLFFKNPVESPLLPSPINPKICHPESACWRMRDLPINITKPLFNRPGL
jgi:hypothetical protein